MRSLGNGFDQRFKVCGMFGQDAGLLLNLANCVVYYVNKFTPANKRNKYQEPNRPKHYDKRYSFSQFRGHAWFFLRGSHSDHIG